MSEEHKNVPSSLLAAAEDTVSKNETTTDATTGSSEQQQQTKQIHPWTKRTTIRTRAKDAVMAVAVSSDDSLVACGFFDGTLDIFDMHTLARIHEMSMNTFKTDEVREKLPVTALSFKPTFLPGGKPIGGVGSTSFVTETQNNKEEESGEEKSAEATTAAAKRSAIPLGSLRPILLACCSDGQFHCFDAQTAERVYGTKEDNEIYACAYNSNGNFFATAGRDSWVRIYDSNTYEIFKKFTIQAPSSGSAPLRIYSLQWSDHATVFAGGWSQTITSFNIFSQREGYVDEKSRHDVFGPVLFGDAMCLVPRREKHAPRHGEIGAEQGEEGESPTAAPSHGNYGTHFDIFTASHRMDDRLEMFDATTMTKIGSIPHSHHSMPFLPLCAAASFDGHWLAAGGGGGTGFTDGLVIIHAPSGAKREKATEDVQAAKAHASALLAQDNTPGTSQHSEELSQATVSGMTHRQVPESQLREHYFTVTEPRPVGDLKQPGVPITCCRFTHGQYPYLVAGDSHGLIHIFEAPRRRY